ncbi:MAG: amino acid ABC transporter substrate-binding protein [Gammaproteobacteria bacterium]|nr:amino acid ABC transporter substrate-binding protein [Gammaproteobacteria bacterium]NIR84395.1 amino acid ABC transporter substrate-binding protein [Gammaproteobacteria bacterium]NIR90876.1 amino acid ABC transporter substrate-binding protein [Gammaproteobacteria bacterium]NIU07062.1 amino acid ABC transporter substrate-binding protein [Gammaproteobacteria bacterium]NIV76191.1 ABC transporter substrate-binding protein [Gammaproteobacteria bacterium]
MHNWLKTLTIALAGAAWLAAVPGAHSAEVIKIGVNQPLTGAVAASGNYVAQGARIAADELNASGGLLGKQVELVIEDNKSNPKEAVAAAEKLIVRDEVPVMMGAWSSTYTLAVMPKLMEYGVPMVVETSSSGKITTSGNPWIFRISPTSEMEAKAFERFVDDFGIEKANFLVVNNDWGLGAGDKFSAMLKQHGAEVGVRETMDAAATDLSAQLAKIKNAGGDTLFLTTGVEQITLVLKQATALRVPHRIITTGGSSSPDQLIEQAGSAAEGTYHILFFAPWFPESAPNPDVATRFVNEWNERDYNFAGLTEGFRGYDGIMTIAAAIRAAGKAEPEAIRDALWGVEVDGVNGDISFIKQGPAGKESAQNIPNVYVVTVKDGKVALPDFGS